jgi:hypothetical protein
MSLRKYLLVVCFTKFYCRIDNCSSGLPVYALVDLTTNHGNEITVPDLSKLTEEQVEEKLDDLDLAYVLLDSVDYRDDFPKYSVVQQDPYQVQK